MTTPTQLQQLARETAEQFKRCPMDWLKSHNTEFEKRILSALEQVSREERKEAEATTEPDLLRKYNSWIGDYVIFEDHKAAVGLLRKEAQALALGLEMALNGYAESTFKEARAALAAWKEKQP